MKVVFEEKIVSREKKTQALSVKKKVEGLDRGLDVYRHLDEDEKNVLIPFAMSHHSTSRDTAVLLRAYSADLDRGVCRESLCIDFIQMARRAYWLEKCTRMKSDMEALGTVPMAEHGYALTKEPGLETTADLYHAIEGNLMEIADLIGEVEEKLAKAPLTLYGGYYHYLRAQYDGEQAVKDFRYWQLQSGVPSLVKLKMLRAEKIADFINSGILELALGSCDIELGDVDVEQFKQQLPHDYPCVKDFDIFCTIFNRTIGWRGDILVPNYDCAGLFIFQHWDELTESDIKAIFYLDEMLNQINEVVRQLSEAEADSAEPEPSICKYDGTDGSDGTGGTPLSMLFREECHEELKTVMESWRPYLKDVEPEKDALCLSTFHFDLDQMQPSTVYIDFARLICHGALIVPMSNLAAYMFSHSNLSKSKNALYVQLKRYKKMCR
ncbi:MAG: hypothetical protein IK075_05820 [Prevotella sp.]|nr:hypothetical protein [Prevotella sp.]